MLAPSVSYFERPLRSGVSSPHADKALTLWPPKTVVMHAHSGFDNKLKFK